MSAFLIGLQISFLLPERKQQPDNPRGNAHIGYIENTRTEIAYPHIHKVGHMTIEQKAVDDIP